jgi:L-aminopeptidase/D-esterase-like protein
MARAIQPFHALDDGDVLYAVSTNEIENQTFGSVGLGVVASELAWDAVLAACNADLAVDDVGLR